MVGKVGSFEGGEIELGERGIMPTKYQYKRGYWRCEIDC